jgi:hypothetical protein
MRYLHRSDSARYKEFGKVSCLIELLLLRVGARRVMLVIPLFREPIRCSADSSGVSPENISMNQHELHSNVLCISLW